MIELLIGERERHGREIAPRAQRRNSEHAQKLHHFERDPAAAQTATEPLTRANEAGQDATDMSDDFKQWAHLDPTQIKEFPYQLVG